MAELLHARHLRHRRRLRRPVGRGRRRRLRRAGGADREGQDGRRLPQLRLRAVEGAARRGASGPTALADAAAVRRRIGARRRSTSPRCTTTSMASIAAIAPNDSAERFTGLGVRVIEGDARFADRRTVAVGEHRDQGAPLRHRDRIVAGGAADPRPRRDAAISPTRRSSTSPQLPRASHRDRRRPDRPRAGAGVPPPRRRGHRAGGRRAARQGRSRMRRRRARPAARAKASRSAPASTVARVERGGRQVAVAVETDGGEETIEGSHLLVAAGRNAECRRARPRRRRHRAWAARHPGRHAACAPPTGASMRSATSPARRSSPMSPTITPASSSATRCSACRSRSTTPSIPWVTYTDPELAQVGLTEARRASAHGDIRVLRWPYHDNDRAQAERETRGHIKVVTTRKGAILGATIVGAAGRRADRHLGARDPAGGRHPRHGRADRPLSDPRGDREARRHELLCAEFDEPLGAAHHRLAAPLRMKPAQ